MTTFITRAYNNIEVVQERGVVIKRSVEKRLDNETQHYLLLPDDVKIWFPRYVDSGKDTDNKYFLELELYAYENLGAFLIEKPGLRSLSNKEWTNVAKLISEAIIQFGKHKTINNNIELDLTAMYKTKTLKEYENLKRNFKDFDEICSQEILSINDTKYQNFEQLWDENEFYWMELIKKEVDFSFFHGDCCFSNILLGSIHDKHVIKFLDPRGLFGTSVAYGDIYYDLAKLAHSTDVGYEYFINDNFSISKIKSNEFIMSYSNNNKERVHKIFSDTIYSKYNKQKIDLIQGLIYIGMCARHYDNKNRQIAMYLSGIKLLNGLRK